MFADLSIHHASMPDAHDVNDEHRIDHLVHDPVIPDSHAIDVLLPCHRHARRWTGVFGEEFNRCADSLLLPSLKASE